MGFVWFVLRLTPWLKPRSTEASRESLLLFPISLRLLLCVLIIPFFTIGFFQSIPPSISSLWFLFIFPLSSFFIYCFFPRVQIKTLETQSMAMKPHGKSIVSSDNDEKVVFFKDLSLGPHEAQLRFRLIHFWEAWNPLKKMLIGMEMLLIDEHVIVINLFLSFRKKFMLIVLHLRILVSLMFLFAGNCYSRIHFARENWNIFAKDEARICLQTRQLLRFQKQVGVSGCWSYRYCVVLMELGVDGSSRLSQSVWWGPFPVSFIWRVSS